MKSIVSVLIALLFFSCAPKRLTPEEAEAERQRQIEMVTRVYEGKSAHDVLMAADRIFRLADEDYRISHSETALQAQRNWMVYLVLTVTFGTDTWIVETFPVDGGTKVVARHAARAQGVTPMPTAGVNGGINGFSASTSPAMIGMSTQPAPYQLFYARMDFLLGKTDKWVTCKDAKQFEGHTDPFCLCASDLLPDGSSSRKKDETRASLNPNHRKE